MADSWKGLWKKGLRSVCGKYDTKSGTPFASILLNIK